MIVNEAEVSYTASGVVLVRCVVASKLPYDKLKVVK